MKLRSLLTAVILILASAPVLAVERYTEARITQFETNDAGIILFLEVLSGDAPPMGNGGSKLCTSAHRRELAPFFGTF